MRIPQKLKVGGVTYAVSITENLCNGMHCIGETNSDLAIINIRESLDPNVQGVTFLHELLHAVAAHLGYTDHDEKKLDELAGALYAVIVDNPEMFEEAKHGNSVL